MEYVINTNVDEQHADLTVAIAFRNSLTYSFISVPLTQCYPFLIPVGRLRVINKRLKTFQ